MYSIDILDPVGLNGMTQTIAVKIVLQHNKLVEIAKILNSHQKPIRDRSSTYFLIFFIFSLFNLLYNSKLMKKINLITQPAEG